jgi:putative transposase
MKARFNYRLYPHPGQAHSLARAFGCARVVWNDALAYCQQTREQRGKTPSGYDLKKIVVTQGKQDPSRAWLAEVSSVVLNESVLDLGVAFKNFFASISGKRKGKRVSPPRFKKRRGRQSIRLTRAGFSIRGNKVYIAKVGRIPVVWSRPLPSAPSSVTVIKDASGRYFASFVCEVEPEILEGGAESVGVDLGITTFATLSTGEKIVAPKPLKKRLKRLRKLQRNLARKVKGSRRRERARRRVAKLHAKIRDTRTDFLHKLSTRLIRESQGVMVEDLNVSGMVKNRKLSRAISDLGWRQFRTLLEGKGIRYGRTVGVVNRWEPTSQICSCCGERGGKLDLSIREWQCLWCGATHDRDINAAKNIQVAGGQSKTLNGRGGTHKSGLPAASGEASTCRDGQQLQLLLFA